MKLVVVVVLALGLVACEDNEKKDFADSISGPGVEVHCRAQIPNRPVVGDTIVDVTCPPQPVE